MSVTFTTDEQHELLTAIKDRIDWLKKQLAYEQKKPCSMSAHCESLLKAAERANGKLAALTVIDDE